MHGILCVYHTISMQGGNLYYVVRDNNHCAVKCVLIYKLPVYYAYNYLDDMYSSVSKNLDYIASKVTLNLL